VHVHIDLFRRIFIAWTIEEAGLPSELQPNRATFNLLLAVCGYLDAILCSLPCMTKHEQCDQKVQLSLPLEILQVLNFEIYDSYLVMIYSLWPLHPILSIGICYSTEASISTSSFSNRDLFLAFSISIGIKYHKLSFKWFLFFFRFALWNSSHSTTCISCSITKVPVFQFSYWHAAAFWRI